LVHAKSGHEGLQVSLSVLARDLLQEFFKLPFITSA
jgi:hypothetical protein